MGAHFDHLCHHTHGNFVYAHCFDRKADRAGDFCQLFRCRDFLFNKSIANEPELARAADHPEEREGFVNPVGENIRVVIVTAGGNEPENRLWWERRRQQVAPIGNAQVDLFWKVFVVRKLGPIVEHCDFEIQIDRERSNCLGDFSTREPAISERVGRGDGFFVKRRQTSNFQLRTLTIQQLNRKVLVNNPGA